ncbi:hypothetical protein AAG570_006362 [Ranatra chinensis]|uniref:Uncharacterized protein n=1 Tax=Ranatra chinensis TaxID=642074 RepID=A0ABD0ZAU6_9HEMI
MPDSFGHQVLHLESRFRGQVTHPPTPDLATSDFHLPTKLKELLGGKRVSNDWQVETVEKWRSFYHEGIKKLVPRPKKYIEFEGENGDEAEGRLPVHVHDVLTCCSSHVTPKIGPGTKDNKITSRVGATRH